MLENEYPPPSNPKRIDIQMARKLGKHHAQLVDSLILKAVSDLPKNNNSIISLGENSDDVQ